VSSARLLREAQPRPRLVRLHDGQPNRARAVGAGGKAQGVQLLRLQAQVRLVELPVPVGRAGLHGAQADAGRAVVACGDDLRLQARPAVLLHDPVCQPVREARVAQHLVAQRFASLAPRAAHGVRVGVLALQPRVPLALQVVLKHLRRAVDVAHQPALNQPVLVVDFDHRDGGVFGVGAPRFGVAMRQQLPRVLLLQVNQRAVVAADGVLRLDIADLVDLGGQSVGGIEASVHQQVEVGVDAPRAQLGEQLVEPRQCLRVELP
jgi:hypothetical protein